MGKEYCSCGKRILIPQKKDTVPFGKRNCSCGKRKLLSLGKGTGPWWEGDTVIVIVDAFKYAVVFNGFATHLDIVGPKTGPNMLGPRKG